MSNKSVRDPDEPCDHGYDIGKCPVDSPVWCPGGKEIILLREVVGPDSFMNFEAIWWVEVPDDETL